MHLTIRMAWHDNKWDGKVCQDPEKNTYCVGVHSLLADKIEKKRNIEIEKHKDVKGKEVRNIKVPKKLQDKFNVENYFPPCYWSINAFGKYPFKIIHTHAFQRLANKTINDTVKPYSFFTWPFKLSFVHNEELKKKRHGNYPPDLDKKRIPEFIKKFTPKQSIIFFYANYDNPVSADDGKYLLLGCSVINQTPQTTKFKFGKEELAEIKKTKINKDGSKNIKMTNFPETNWAIQFTHDPNSAVLLPYKEYIDYTEEHPDDELLDDMKVIIEEESLVKSFKYVAMDIDDDKCLYLLYKIRKSIKKIQDHKNVVIKDDLEEEENRIKKLIDMVWKQRGVYPSLHKVINHFLDDKEVSEELSKELIKLSSPEKDLHSLVQELIKNKIPKELKKYSDEIDDLIGERTFKKYYQSLIKLSLINLTAQQIEKIMDDKNLLETIKNNPYVLYEDYYADENDLDEPDLVDEPIDLYKIDVGIIPDRKFVKRHREIQNLREDSPERTRSVIINYLNRIKEYGHCYDSDDNIIQEIKENPLIYKNDKVEVDEESIKSLDDDYKSHFIEKLHITKPIDSKRFYYLNKIKKQEEHIKKIVDSLLKKTTNVNFSFDRHLGESIYKLKDIPNFDKEQFKKEREQLFKNVFALSLFLLTGRPGTGKTREATKVIETLEKKESGGDIVVLAPTGKAALRLTENIRRYSSSKIEAMTIDKLIYKNKYGWAYDDFDKLMELKDKDKLTVSNLIIDESSMVDLEKLFILFSIIRFDEKHFKRLILIGDENQLPPIGYGKPFYDIIQYILKNEKYLNHYVHFSTNCRQENDENIIKLSEAFSDRKRYYEEAIEILNREKEISTGLHIYKWKDKEQLEKLLQEQLEIIFNKELEDKNKIEFDKSKKLNLLFGLYESGYLKDHSKTNLSVDKFQILSPYRPGYYGTLGLNKYIQSEYRDGRMGKYSRPFYHSDKLIRIVNWYTKDRKKLRLSNGSIGIHTYSPPQKYKKEIERYFFPDAEEDVIYKIDNDENFDLAYAITVHKSQGSEFKNVFLIIPRKSRLLFRELIYTALTRSKYRLFIFIQENEVNLLEKARNISNLLYRKTSIFEDPFENEKKYKTKNGIPVRSKVELDICQLLENSGLTFEYERELSLGKRDYAIHPDFTITIGDRKIFWEHLGMLDIRKYYRDWLRCKEDYKDHSYFDNVITTDDLEGIDNNIIDQIIRDIKKGKLKTSSVSKFSNHHYQLYK
jgi:exodeoxyribonuclease V alpha subunit